MWPKFTIVFFLVATSMVINETTHPDWDCQIKDLRTYKPYGLIGGKYGEHRFFQKYMRVYKFPVYATEKVSTRAMERICYAMRQVFFQRVGVLTAFCKIYGRLEVMREDEFTMDNPDHHNIFQMIWQSTLQSIIYISVGSDSEEKSRCFGTGIDKYDGKDIILYEIVKGIVDVVLKQRLKEFYAWINSVFQDAKKSGKTNVTSPGAYMGEAAQSFFNINIGNQQANGTYQRSQKKLKMKDPHAFNLFESLTPFHIHYTGTYSDICDDDVEVAEQVLGPKEIHWDKFTPRDCSDCFRSFCFEEFNGDIYGSIVQPISNLNRTVDETNAATHTFSRSLLQLSLIVLACMH